MPDSWLSLRNHYAGVLHYPPTTQKTHDAPWNPLLEFGKVEDGTLCIAILSKED